MMSDTIAGGGSVRCQRCGHVLLLSASDVVIECPGCKGRSFVRAPLCSAEESARRQSPSFRLEAAVDVVRLAGIRERLAEPGEYLAFIADGREEVVRLTCEWTRIGRSLNADVRLDDPTVSRRHALIGRPPEGVRLLDDRSLNGVFVNGARVGWTRLRDGDEIGIGRYRLSFLSLGLDTDSRSSRDGLPASAVSVAALARA